MKKFILVSLGMVLTCFLLMGPTCDPVSFDSETSLFLYKGELTINLTIGEKQVGTEKFVTASNSYNMEDVYLKDLGLSRDELNSIKEVSITDIKIKFIAIKNQTKEDIIFESGVLTYMKPGTDGLKIAEIPEAINTKFSEFAEPIYSPLNETIGKLGTVPDNIKILRTDMSKIPPPNIPMEWTISGIDASSRPVNFKIDLTLVLQVKSNTNYSGSDS